MAEIIQGVSYKRISFNPEIGDEVFFVVPKDLNGNLFNEVTIECDTSLGAMTVTLPEIASLNNNWNISIIIVNSNVSIAKVNVEAFSGDLIGSTNALFVETPNGNVILTPVSSTVWSAVLTA
jgi:hypothetical protein